MEAPGLSAVFPGLVPLRMLASSDMSKLVFMILVLHSTFMSGISPLTRGFIALYLYRVL